jgi:large subunit ribosomal protein L22
MEFVATQKITRQSPRKVRLVANQVKSLALPEVLKQLAVIERRATLVLLKTIKQAIANAQNNHQVAFEDLELKELIVNEGPTYKRFRAVSRGQAHKILKRTCHIRVVLRTKGSTAEAAAVAAKTAKPVPTVKAETTVTEEKATTPKKTKAATESKETKTTKKPATKKATTKTTKEAKVSTKKTASSKTK